MEVTSVSRKRIMFDWFILFQQTGKVFNVFHYFFPQKEKYYIKNKKNLTNLTARKIEVVYCNHL